MRNRNYRNTAKSSPASGTNCRLLAGMAFPVGMMLSAPSYAYIDPATGSIILQSLLAGIAVAMGALRFYWAKLKSFFSGSPANVETDKSAGHEATSEEAKVRGQT